MQIRKTVYITTAAGLALFIALIMREGVQNILSVLSLAGWSLLGVVGFRIAPIILDSIGWSSLITKKNRVSRMALFQARWVAESFNTLLPVAQVGGHVIRAKMLSRQGVPTMEAAANVMVDFTLGTATQFIFILMGGVLLFNARGGGGETTGFLLGMAIAFFLLLVFYMTQRAGFFSHSAQFIQRIIRHRELVSLVGGAKTLDQKIGDVYQRHRDLLICAVFRLLAWITKSGEILLALYLLGFPVTFSEALIMESLSTAVASAAFIVPGALGVREGGIVIIGNLIGLTPEVSLALALIKRAREVIVGIPGLLTWLIAEGRILRKSSANETDTNHP